MVEQAYIWADKYNGLTKGGVSKPGSMCFWHCVGHAITHT